MITTSAPPLQRFRHRGRAEIGVGGDQAVAELADRAVEFHDREVALLAGIEDVVTDDGRDLQEDSPIDLAMAAVLRAAASGLAAPILVTILMPLAAQTGNTARIRSSSSGS